MADVHLQTLNAVHIKVVAEPGIIMEMAEHFTFMAPNYKFHPKYKARLWNGKISLLNRLTGTIYAGLAKRIKQFCDARGYTMSFDEGCAYNAVSREDVIQFIKGLGLPDWIELRDYQIDAVHKCIVSNRRLLLSPTSSGKSLIIYMISQWFNLRTLIIVPSNGLVDQFKSDLTSYGFKGTIATSKEKITKKNLVEADVVISTWQALDNGRSKVASTWLSQFEVVFGDEAHGAKSASMISILSSMTNCYHRFGTTGTLDGEALTLNTVEGLFGPEYRNITTREMIDQGDATNVKIRCIVLKYPPEVAKKFRNERGRFASYPEEIAWITESQLRNNFITKLANKLEGNRIVFFKRVEHGKLLNESFGDRENVYYIDGGVKDRERIRKSMEEEEDAILLASIGTTATGVSIRKLHSMINTHPMKGQIKLLQSIGRMLRQHEDKNVAIIYDIVDDLSTSTYKNYTLKHFEARAALYDREGFDYTIHNVFLKE